MHAHPSPRADASWGVLIGLALTCGACVDRGQRALDGDQIDEAREDGLCLRLSPSTLDFGTVPYGERRTRSVTVEGCGERTPDITSLSMRWGQLFSMPSDVKGDLLTQPVVSPREISLTFTADTPGSHQDSLIVSTDDPTQPTIEIPIEAIAGRPGCPTPQIAPLPRRAEPLDVIQLDGGESVDGDGEIRAWRWAVVERPDHSIARVVEGYTDADHPAEGGPEDDPATPEAAFFLDLAGRYTFELTVEDDEGLMSPSAECPAQSRVSVEVIPSADLHLQLTWHTPLDEDETDSAGTDVDLYLLHPFAEGDWRAQDYACYYLQKTPQWGDPDSADDDPTLDIDDTNGAGPENINLRSPEHTGPLGGPYQIGAHYYRASARDRSRTYGASEVQVKIFISGALMWSGEQRLRRTDDLWDVAQVEWGPEGGEIIPVDRVYDRLDGVMP